MVNCERDQWAAHCCMTTNKPQLTWCYKIYLGYHFYIDVPSTHNSEPKTSIDALHSDCHSNLLTQSLGLNLQHVTSLLWMYTQLVATAKLTLVLAAAAGEGGSGDTIGLVWKSSSISSTALWISASSWSAVCSCSNVSLWPFSISSWSCHWTWPAWPREASLPTSSSKWADWSCFGFWLVGPLLWVIHKVQCDTNCCLCVWKPHTFVAEVPDMMLLNASRSSWGPL